MGVKKSFGDTVKQGFEGRGLAPTPAGFTDDEETVVVPVRLHKKRKEALARLFKARGIGIGPGIRMVIYEWLDSQGGNA